MPHHTLFPPISQRGVAFDLMCRVLDPSDPTLQPSRVKFPRGKRQWSRAEGCLKGNSKGRRQLGSCPSAPRAQVCTAAEGKTFRMGTPAGSAHHTNGKKKLKGSLALMVGGARKPASAGADTSTNVTAVEMTTVLSGPGRGCKEKTEWTPSPSPRSQPAALRH